MLNAYQMEASVSIRAPVMGAISTPGRAACPATFQSAPP